MVFTHLQNTYGTAREKEILVLLLEGKSNNEIAENLFISQHTIKTHNSNIFKKLDVQNRFELLSKIIY